MDESKKTGPILLGVFFVWACASLYWTGFLMRTSGFLFFLSGVGASLVSASCLAVIFHIIELESEINSRKKRKPENIEDQILREALLYDLQDKVNARRKTEESKE